MIYTLTKKIYSFCVRFKFSYTGYKSFTPYCTTQNKPDNRGKKCTHNFPNNYKSAS